MFEATTDTASLPVPGEDALEQSAALVASIRASIERKNLPISLGDYVHQALYTPQLGYYAAGTRKFGEQGDFVTAPELGSVFAECVARGIRRVFNELNHDEPRHACVLELGAGSGQFAYDCLRGLHDLDVTPHRYYILEVSADLRERQQELLATLPHDLFERVEWLAEPLAEPFEGVVFANEVIDALPVERFGVNVEGEVLMECIDTDSASEQELRSVSAPATAAIAEAVERLAQSLEREDEWQLPFVSEIRMGLKDWLHSVTRSLVKGVVLLVDYGSDAAEVYRGDRTSGTLLCHYRHRAHDNVLLWPGLQDITCWVDFSQVANAARELGWTLDGYTSQAHLLIDLELDAVASARFETASAKDRLRLASEMKQLTLPGEMGERFKAMALSRGLERGLLTPAHTSLERRL